MFSRFSFRILKVLVVVFPIAAGLFLTGLGWVRLNEAIERPVSKPLAPYGILAFSSQECEGHSLRAHMDGGIDAKKNLIGAHFESSLALKAQDSPYEEIFGFQIPYYASDFGSETRVTAFSKPKGLEVGVETEILEKNVIFAGNLTSIIYLKFIASPQFQWYEVDIHFTWRDLIIRTAFSTYEIVVPFSYTTHNIVHEHLSNIHLLDFASVDLYIRLPEDSEIRETIPPPDEEVLHSHLNPEEPRSFMPIRILIWSLPAEKLKKGEAPIPISEIVRVRFELSEEADLRGQLFFDSGLYMGLGISLVFGGIHEAFKIQMELKRKQTE